MARLWLKKNPFMSLWPSGANTTAGRAPRAGGNHKASHAILVRRLAGP
jgi:hypothetical protein